MENVVLREINIDGFPVDVYNHINPSNDLLSDWHLPCGAWSWLFVGWFHRLNVSNKWGNMHSTSVSCDVFTIMKKRLAFYWNDFAWFVNFHYLPFMSVATSSCSSTTPSTFELRTNQMNLFFNIYSIQKLWLISIESCGNVP